MDLLVLVGNALFKSIQVEGVSYVIHIDLHIKSKPWVNIYDPSLESPTYFYKELVAFEFDEPRDPASVAAAL